MEEYIIQKKKKKKQVVIICQIKNREIYSCEYCDLTFPNKIAKLKHIQTPRHIGIKTRTQQIENLTPQ